MIKGILKPLEKSTVLYSLFSSSLIELGTLETMTLAICNTEYTHFG